MRSHPHRRVAAVSLWVAALAMGIGVFAFGLGPASAEDPTPPSSSSSSTSSSTSSTTTTEPSTTTTQVPQSTTTTKRATTTSTSTSSTSTSTSTSTTVAAAVVPPGYKDPNAKGSSFWTSGRKLFLVVFALLAAASAMGVLTFFYWKATRPAQSTSREPGFGSDSPETTGPIGPVSPMLAEALRPDPFTTRDDLGLL